MRFTEQETKLLTQLNDQGLSIREIATSLQRPRDSIANKLFTLRIKSKFKRGRRPTEEEINLIIKMRADGNSGRFICRTLNINQFTLKRWLKSINAPLKQRYYISPENAILIKKYIQDGKHYKEIGELVNISKFSIRHFCQENNIHSQFSIRRKELKELRKQGLAKCFVCSKIYPFDCFVDAKEATYLCKYCQPAYNREFIKHNNLEEAIINKLKFAKIKCRKTNRVFDITKDDILNLWEKQQGRCFYTGQNMSYLRCDPNIVSIDRKDSNLSYTKDNIVLCTWQINELKNKLKDSDFVHLCKMVACHSYSSSAPS